MNHGHLPQCFFTLIGAELILHKEENHYVCQVTVTEEQHENTKRCQTVKNESIYFQTEFELSVSTRNFVAGKSFRPTFPSGKDFLW